MSLELTLTIITIVATMSVVWGMLLQRVINIEARMTQIETRLTRMEGILNEIIVELRGLTRRVEELESRR